MYLTFFHHVGRHDGSLELLISKGIELDHMCTLELEAEERKNKRFHIAFHLTG